MCAFLLLPVFLFATASLKSDELECTPQLDSVGEIFLSEGVMLVGKENIYNAEVLLENDLIAKESAETVQESQPKGVEVIVAQKKLQEIKTVNKAPKVTLRFNFFKSSSGDSTFDKKGIQDWKAVFSSRSLLQKIGIADRYENEFATITSQFKKQVFYSFLSYLQSATTGSASLRAPPIYRYYLHYVF